jgi:hypothetical protein
MRTLQWIIVVTATVAAADAAAAQDWARRFQIGDGQWLEIKGVNGSVRAVAATGNEVEVEVTKSARRDDPDEVNIEVVQHAGGVTICAIYPQGRSREPNDCQPGNRGRTSSNNNDVKVDFLVRVPGQASFAGRTVNGGVTVTGLSGDVRAHTVNGSVRVSTAGLAEATTVNGSIEVAMGRADWEDVLEFETVNGSIIVELPDNVNTEVHASTVSGSIATDYPLTVRGRFGPKRMSGTIGRGGRELALGTVNGDIEIRRR